MKTFIKTTLFLALGVLPTLVYAEDIEIYMDPQPALGGEPLVMFTLDYRPNLNSTLNLSSEDQDFFEEELGFRPAASQNYFTVLRLALRVVFKDLAGVKIGLMMPHNHSNNCEGPTGARPGCGNGGFIMMGFQSINRDDSNGQKARFLQYLEDIPVPGVGQGSNPNHPWQFKEMTFELFRYLTGQGVYNGRNGHISFPGLPASNNNQNLNVNFPHLSWDESIMEATGQTVTHGSGGNQVTIPLYNYISPLQDATACTRIFTINFAFGVQTQGDDSNAAIHASRADGGYGIVTGTAAGGLLSALSYLYDADLADGQHGSTLPQINGKQNIMGWLLTDQANPARSQISQAMGGGNAIPVFSNPRMIVDTLNSLFQQILSVSTTFVAASVPVNVFNRSEIVDNV